jgi:hypothetical protein
MNYTLEITMTYTGLGGNPDGSVVEICTADITDLKLLSENVGGGRRQDTITGNIIIYKEYDDYATYLNDDSGYYVDPEDFSYDLYVNGQQLNTNNLKLVINDIENKRLTLSAFGDCINEYTNVYANWDVERNVVAGVDPPSAPIKKVSYSDFRTLATTTSESVGPVALPTQTQYNNFIDSLIDAFPAKQVYRVVLTSVAGFYSGTAYYKELQALGYYNGSEADPPAGDGWTYQFDSGGHPFYTKRPQFVSVDYDDLTTNMDQTINIEAEADVVYGDSYPSTQRTLEDVLTYLFQKADATIDTDGNTYDGFHVLGAGSFNGSSQFMANAFLFTVADFIPTISGTQKDNAATKGYMSLNAIMSYLEQLGFYWYLEEIASVFYLRIQHITLKSLSGSSNPDIDSYSYKTRTLNIQPQEFDKINNDSTSSWFDFRKPDYKFKTGTKTKPFSSNEIITDLDYVIDAKDAIFDEKTGRQWVLCATTKNGTNYEVRHFTSSLTILDINNYELSFYWLSTEFMEMPGRYDEDDNDLGTDRLTKRKEVDINLPIDNPQSDYTFYELISYFDEDAEIQRIEKNILSSEGTLKIRYL